jgi:tetratricopeptide (TPR) repeat protein
MRRWYTKPWAFAVVGIAAALALMVFMTRPREERVTIGSQALPEEPNTANLDAYLTQIRVGTTAYRAQQYAEATQAFETAMALQPSEHLPYRYLAELHWRAGRQEQASRAVRSLAMAMPAAYFLDQVGRAYEEIGLHGLAVLVYQATVDLDPQFPSARYNLGRLLLESGDLPRGIAAMQETIRLHPDFPEAHQALGMAYTEQGDFEDAIVHLERALALHPQLTVVRNHLGRLYLAQGRLEEAIQTFRALIAEVPDIPEARHNLAVSYARQGRPEPAIEQFREALRLRPNFHAARIDMATLLLEAGRLHEAIDTLKAALALAASGPEAGDRQDMLEVRYRLGVAYRLAGQLRDAIQEMHTVVQVQSGHAGAHANLARLYYQTQRFDAAWRHARRAESLGFPVAGLLAALRLVSAEPP